MEKMRQVAYTTVSRACGFAALAVFCVMIGMSFMPTLAFQTGGFLTIVTTLVLIYKAREAQTKNHRHTEMWLYLEKHERPAPEIAQLLSARILEETYLTFALWTSVISIAMWIIALLFSLAGL